MPTSDDKPNGKRRRTTAKRVQAEESKPFTLPDARPAPEVDEDEWGADRLTHKQRLFVRFYVGEAAGNATKAARLAGYRSDNLDSLKATAHETLTKPYVQRAIARIMAERFGSAEDVRAGIAEIANANAADFLIRDADGKLHFDLEKAAEAAALGLIKGMDEDVFEVEGVPGKVVKRKIKFHDRLKALELLGKMNGQFIDRLRHEGEVKFHPITLDGDKQASTGDGDAGNPNAAAPPAPKDLPPRAEDGGGGGGGGGVRMAPIDLGGEEGGGHAD